MKKPIDSPADSERLISSGTTPAELKMNTILKMKADIVAANDALFRVSIKQAEHAGLQEIRISVPRARQILHDLIVLKKALETPARREPSHFNRLDAIFEHQAECINRALTTIVK